jgi:hypothetical protein
MTQSNHNDWIQQAKSRGWGDFLSLAFDALEPLGPLGAQVLWTAQPALSLFVSRSTLHSLAQALDEPGGMERLRQQLEEQPPPTDG